MDLTQLHTLCATARDCASCRLAETRTQVVWGSGNESAHVMLIGEAPGRNEDLGGAPFIGAAGRILDEALAAARRAAAMNVVAGQHFNRGQRAFFFALAYAAWFISPVAFMVATIAVLIPMIARQFGSAAHDAVLAISHGRPAKDPE